ncbi:hypothetical protein JL09_g6762 [Pichia kudriavzevii]|uniref:Uncharacterized protein n=1 Tax=Pichia kudriavzevii TaxID=4909 RepID=A0A099NL06_PICKU|nr:hypothetical protein JL09_g6762 [Pichia kudriavzevii]
MPAFVFSKLVVFIYPPPPGGYPQ